MAGMQNKQEERGGDAHTFCQRMSTQLLSTMPLVSPELVGQAHLRHGDRSMNDSLVSART